MNIITDPNTIKQIKDAVVEIANSMHRIQGEKDFIKEATKAICEEHGLDKKIFNKSVKTYFKQNFKEQVTESDEFTVFYSNLTGEKIEEENE